MDLAHWGLWFNSFFITEVIPVADRVKLNININILFLFGRLRSFSDKEPKTMIIKLPVNNQNHSEYCLYILIGVLLLNPLIKIRYY